MVVDVLKILAKDHKKWLRISKSFGLTEDAEDLVQNMYLKIYDWKGKYDKTLMFSETEVNHYFVFLVLRNLFLDLCRTNKKEIRLESEFYDKKITRQVSLEYKEQLTEIKKEIASWHLYDRKIYELIFIEDYNMSELARQTGINYDSIRRTRLKIEKLLNQKIKK